MVRIACSTGGRREEGRREGGKEGG
eukprot:COSAG03_NODE_5194_length_1319_cov_1.911475_4_plen_24_part_01